MFMIKVMRAIRRLVRRVKGFRGLASILIVLALVVSTLLSFQPNWTPAEMVAETAASPASAADLPAESGAEPAPVTEADMPARTLTAKTAEKKAEDRVTVVVEAPEGALPADAAMEVRTVTDKKKISAALHAAAAKENESSTEGETAVTESFEGKTIDPETTEGGASPVEVSDVSAEIEDAENPAAAEGSAVEESAAGQSDSDQDEGGVDEEGIPLINDLIRKILGDGNAENAAEETELALPDSGKTLRAKAVDITFRDASGRKIEPAGAVRVRISADVIADSEDDPTIVHVKNNGRTEVVAPADAEDVSVRSADDEVVFDANQFSVYAVIYTVDFANGDNIYHLKGSSSALLSEILQELKIKSAGDGQIVTVEDVTNVRFSDESLVSITQEENDWLLTAEEPFDTEETLTLTLKNGGTVSIQVTDDQTDFGQYISKVVVEKQVGSGWVQTTEFNNGDTVRIRLAYNLPAGVITAAKKTVTYQLPDGVKPGQSENGDITKNGKKVGTYTINTNGLVTLTFDDAFAQDGKGIDGTIRFQGTVSNTSGESSRTITFPGKGSAITVITPQQDNYDISTAKEGSVNADHTKASYKVTVSTNNGTGNSVTVSDQFSHDQSSNASFDYDPSSLAIVKVFSDSHSEKVSPSEYTVNWTPADNGDPGFEITGLPALEAGEKYEVTYDANISLSDPGKKATVVNQAHSRSGSHDGWARNSEEIHPPLEKTGAYDPKTNTFSWTLWLNNGNGADVSSWKITDTPDYPIVGSVTVYCRSRDRGDIYVGSKNFSGKKRFDLDFSDLQNFGTLTPDQKKDSFYIVYSTQAPEGNPGQTVSERNQAWCNPDGSYVDITAEGTLRDWNVAKQYKSEDTGSVDSDGKVYEHWSSEVTLPVGSLTGFTYIDNIEAVLDDAGKDQHFATAKDLENYFTREDNPNGNRNTGLYLKLGEYERYNYNGAGQAVTKSNYYGSKDQDDIAITVIYYDAKGQVVQPDDDHTPVKSFAVTVTPKPGSTVTAQSLVLKDYRTVVDTTTQKDGEEWTIKNKGAVRTKSSEAEGKYKKPYTFDKQVYTGKVNGAAVYKDGSQKVPYQWAATWDGPKDGQLKYRLMLHTAQTDQGKITITDTLPAGMTLVQDSVYAKFFVNENTQHDENWVSPESNFQGNSKPSVAVEPNEDGTTKLTITIPNYYYSSSYPDVAVYYTVDLSPEEWNDLNTTEKTYRNTAEWIGHTTSTNEVTVTREKTVLEKRGVQLDKDGNPVELGADGKPKTTPSGILQYAIVINPAAEDLVPNADQMTLTDTLTGAADYNPQLNLDSVALYAYDPARPDHRGKKLDDRTYIFKYDNLNSKITLTIPDSRALVFVYQYALEDNYTGEVQISNEASLNGKWSTKKEVRLVETSSSATAEKKEIVLYKVDSQNYRHPLPGTKFKLERYDGNQQWTQVDKDGNINSDAVLTADSEGKIEWDLSGQNPPIQADKLYRLTETKAQDGYWLDATHPTHHYFIWCGEEDSNADEAYNKAVAGNQADQGTGAVSKDEISIFPHTGGVMYIENTYTRIAVEKVWQNADGSPGTMPEDAQVQVQLQRQKAETDGYWIQVTSNTTQQNGTQFTSKKLYVEKNSKVTVRVHSPDPNAAATISYGTTTAPMTPSTYQYNRYLTYTIAEVTENLNIRISTSDWNYSSVTFADYTPAPDVYTTEYVYKPVTLQLDSTAQKEHGGGLYYVWDDRDDLPQTDSAGKPYSYTVREVSVKQNGKEILGNYQVSYVNNGGIQSGQITIINTKDDSGVTLPSTGGPGARRYIGMGAALFATAAFLYGIKHIIHRRREVLRS